MLKYQDYKYLALLCIAFNLTDKGNKSISIDKVKEKIEEIFPEEENFSTLLQGSESADYILINNNNIVVTEIGIEMSQQYCERIIRKIKRRKKEFRCVSRTCQGKNLILGKDIKNGACPHCGSIADLREVK